MIFKIRSQEAGGLSEAWYEVIALAARYVFLALAAAVVLLGWRSHRAALKESVRNRREGAAIGEMRVIGDVSGKLDGKTYPVPMEGIIGSARSCDVRLKSRHVRRRHVYFEQRQGCLVLTPIGAARAEGGSGRGEKCLLYDGDQVRLGGVILVMTFYDAEDARRPENEDE